MLAKFELFNSEVKARIKIGSRYTNKLKEQGFSKCPFISSENSSVYAQYTIQVNNRKKVVENMNKMGIPTSVHYPSLLSDQEALKDLKHTNKSLLRNILSKKIFKNNILNNAKEAASNVLSLPMHPYLSEDNQNLVINSLIESLN